MEKSLCPKKLYLALGAVLVAAVIPVTYAADGDVKQDVKDI